MTGPLLAAIALLAAAGTAAAQPTPAPTPTQQPPAATPAPAPLPPERGRVGGSTLNLQLDDASRRRIMSGAVEEGSRGAGRDLPALGEGARKIDPALTRGSPYPKSYNDIEAPY